MTSAERIQAILLTAIAPIVWGSTYIVTTELLPADSPLLASAIRALPAGLLLIAYTRCFPNQQWWGKLACLGVLNIGLFFYCLFFCGELPTWRNRGTGHVEPADHSDVAQWVGIKK